MNELEKEVVRILVEEWLALMHRCEECAAPAELQNEDHRTGLRVYACPEHASMTGMTMLWWPLENAARVQVLLRFLKDEPLRGEL